jgi:ApaG protein
MRIHLIEPTANGGRLMSENGPGGGRATPRDKASMREDYALTTRGVTVTVRSFFLADQSSPDDNRFVWAYRVRIENQGTDTVRLLRRTWQITDARGRTQHVHGPGVVGEQPVLDPGQSFEYTSGTPLETPSGFMVGAYHMVVPGSGENFDVAIPAFSLDSPHQSGRIH